MRAYGTAVPHAARLTDTERKRFMEYTENKILPERALLVALDTGEYDAESSLDELWELAKSGGAEPVATLTQKRPAPGR